MIVNTAVAMILSNCPLKKLLVINCLMESRSKSRNVFESFQQKYIIDGYTSENCYRDAIDDNSMTTMLTNDRAKEY